LPEPEFEELVELTELNAATAASGKFVGSKIYTECKRPEKAF